jgi:hypothetical protein
MDKLCEVGELSELPVVVNEMGIGGEFRVQWEFE